MDDSKKNIEENPGAPNPPEAPAEPDAPEAPGAGPLQGHPADAPAESAPEKPGAARILARAGEAFDASRASRDLHESGLKDADKLEPTDQSFIFAEPGELAASAARRGPAPERAEASRSGPGRDGLGAAQPALDLTEAPDPDIPWRARPLSPGAEPLPMGVLSCENAPERPVSLYDAEPGLFGPGDPWLPDSDEADGEAVDLVLGVKFREYGPVYFFRAGKENIKAGGRVLVESEQGLSMAEVISARRMRSPLPKIRTAEGAELEIKPILGLPGAEDIAADADNKILASGARLFCKQCIRERNLDMKLVDVEVLHDRSKIIFYFTAPTRIDFRELVKDLVRNYRTRIELRQIGVRHETQMLGALGNCGMACCCRRYLRRFAPVTIKMAKEQNLFLNPAKLSGICGRLLCCLANEQENYEEFHRNCPKIGKKYQTSRGVLRVLRANLFRQSIVAVGEGGEEEEFQLDSWRALEPQRLEARDGRESRPGAPVAGQPETAEDNERGPSVFMGEEVSEAELAGLEDDSLSAPKKGRAEGHRPEGRRSESHRPEGQRAEGRQHHDRQHHERSSSDQPRRDGSAPRRDQGPHGQRGGHGRHHQSEGSVQSSPGAHDGDKTPGVPRAEARPEQHSEQRAQQRPQQRRDGRTDADKSIFGLPGFKHQK